MPRADDLAGLGFSGEQANALGNTPTLLTCTGTTQGAAALIKSTNVELSAASSQTGAIFNSNSPIGTPHYVFCSSSTSAVVYAPSGENLNGTLNGGLTVAQNKAAVVIQYKNNNWSSVLTA